jgi:hypothetical protein
MWKKKYFFKYFRYSDIGYSDTHFFKKLLVAISGFHCINITQKKKEKNNLTLNNKNVVKRMKKKEKRKRIF